MRYEGFKDSYLDQKARMLCMGKKKGNKTQDHTGGDDSVTQSQGRQTMRPPPCPPRPGGGRCWGSGKAEPGWSALSSERCWSRGNSGRAKVLELCPGGLPEESTLYSHQ